MTTKAPSELAERAVVDFAILAMHADLHQKQGASAWAKDIRTCIANLREYIAALESPRGANAPSELLLQIENLQGIAHMHDSGTDLYNRVVIIVKAHLDHDRKMKAELAALADEVDLVADEIWRVGHTASHRLNLVRYERTVLLLATLGGLLTTLEAADSKTEASE